MQEDQLLDCTSVKQAVLPAWKTQAEGSLHVAKDAVGEGGCRALRLVKKGNKDMSQSLS